MNKTQHCNVINLPTKLISPLLILSILFVIGCSTSKVATTHKDDPYENFNRSMFTFNDRIDGYLAKPISDGYKYITPELLQTGVYNFYNNLKNVNIVINDSLQGKFSQSAQDSGRLALNSTLGLAGFFDVAKSVGWEQNEEDFDQTMAVWGVPAGSYLVLPILGPSTFRGIPGAAFDTATNPSTYFGKVINIVSLINTRANAEGALKFIDEAALDPYVFTRESFLQWRNNLATDGKSQSSYDLDLEDDLESSPKDKPKKTTTETSPPKTSEK